ncbi:MAG: hypothetical protein MUC97_08875 [Bernardetiaceae bacterium]|jgi:hypothetical protein|nr:hypothetical protein [Bernardetiaceae bacterium]
MIKIIRLACICCFLGGLVACGGPTTVAGFDQAAWQADRNGCQGQRAALLEALQTKVKPQMVGHWREDEVLDVLGRPDRIEMATRGQKFFNYFIDPGQQCPQATGPSLGRWVQVRYDALGQVSELAVQDLRPAAN